MPPSRRRGASPNAEDLAGLGDAPAPGRLRKAPAADPVLGVAAASAPNPAPESSPAAAKGAPAKTKVGFYQSVEDTARARAAYDWTRPRTRHRSFSDFIAHAVMREVERLEAEYNDGQPWPSLEPGELPAGRPMGS